MENESSRPRVLAHVDLDAFYAQVEMKTFPELKGKPLAVVQYNPFETYDTSAPAYGISAPDRARIMPNSNGSIIAVSYEARAFGVKRNMMAQQGKKLCPDLNIVQVPTAHGKADLTLYRTYGGKVADILSRLAVTERASIDEVYLDVTAEAVKRLAALPAGSSPPEPTSFKGLHVAGQCESAPEPEPALDAGQGGRPGGAVEPHPDLVPCFKDEYCRGLTSLAGPSSDDECDGARLLSGLAERAFMGDIEQGKLSKHAVSTVGTTTADTTSTAQGDKKCSISALDKGSDIDPLQAAALAAQAWWRRPASAWDEDDANARLLAAGAAVVTELRSDVLRLLGFTCSAGVSHHKILSKLGSGMHKPAQQTVVPATAVPFLLGPLAIARLRGLGGKLGEQVASTLGITTVGELAALSLPRMESVFPGGLGSKLWHLARGIDGEEVEERMLPKSMNCGKTFRGSNALTTLEELKHWLSSLSDELSGRLIEDEALHGRRAQTLTVAVSGTSGKLEDGVGGSMMVQPLVASRSGPLRKLSMEAISEESLALAKKIVVGKPAWRVTSMFITASGFQECVAGMTSIVKFLSKAGQTAQVQHSQRANIPTAEQPSGTLAQRREASLKEPYACDAHSALLTHSRAHELSSETVNQQQWLTRQPYGGPRSAAATSIAPQSKYHSLRYEDIDEAVLRELPFELQKELLDTLNSTGSVAYNDSRTAHESMQGTSHTPVSTTPLSSNVVAADTTDPSRATNNAMKRKTLVTLENSGRQKAYADIRHFFKK